MSSNNPFADSLEEEAEVLPVPNNEAAFMAEMEPTVRALWQWAGEHDMPILIAMQLGPPADGVPGTHIIAVGVGPTSSETMQFLGVSLTQWLKQRAETGMGSTREMKDFTDLPPTEE